MHHQTSNNKRTSFRMNNDQDIIKKCVGVCILNEHLTCIGCGRTMQEIDDSGDRRSLPIVIADKKSHSVP